MMGVACGIMGWSPDQFWTSTPHEFMAAATALRRFHQAGDDDDARAAEFAAFRESIEAGERARDANG